MARIVQFNPAARVGFVIPEKAMAYYRKGMDQWYLWWGNDVFTANGDPLVEALGKVSRHLEQIAAIDRAVQPAMRIVDTPASAAELELMVQLKERLIVAAWLVGGLLVIAIILGILLWRRSGAERALHGH